MNLKPLARLGVSVVVLTSSGLSAWAIVSSQSDLLIVQKVEGTAIARMGGHLVQAKLTKLVQSGQNAQAFVIAQ